jgi:hypothetical protein
MTVQQRILPFKIEVTSTKTRATARGGLPVILECLRAVVRRSSYRRLVRALAYKGWKTVRRHLESLVLLIADGGECLADLEHLRADEGLRRLIGFRISSPTQAKEFLYAFHQAENGQRLTKEDDRRLSVVGKATIRPEGPGQCVLASIIAEVVRQVQAFGQQIRATLDVDATVIEASKATALKAYEGTVGYQPQMAWWAEQGVWIQDEFRDGNVPAAFAVKGFLVRAFAALPGSVQQRRLRGDSALYEEDALTWLADQKIEFAVSADMSPSLLGAIRAIPEAEWQPYRTLKDSPNEDRSTAREEREWAEVPDFVPDWRRNRKKEGKPLRYVAVRVRSRQRDLLTEDGERWRHFAIVTNMDWAGERLLRWHREKQGTVEHAHGVIKNELAGGTLPCGRFASNAAWWRINVLVQDLLQLLKVKALPRAMAFLRPKALRYRLLHVPGLVIFHARQVVLRLTEGHPAAELLMAVRTALADLFRSPPPPSEVPAVA